MTTPHLSLVIPAYNEEGIIKSNLEKVLKFLSKKSYLWEIVVVDDGSRDNTPDIVNSLKKVRLVKLPENMGKGAAVKAGMLKARGKLIIFMDADLSVPLNYIDVVVRALHSSDVAIGSRRVKGSVIKKHQPFLRENMGRVFTKLTQIIIGSKIADFTCGFKGFTKEAASKVFAHGVIDRWAYDAEIIFLAEKFGLKITEVPVEWINREETRVKVGRATIESLIDLVKIRFFGLAGKYED
ncbi:hypothetical protein A2803_02650 [Candidatus Woesebacteria bacterium RIFCSPHIGHO2_01_FULL_44_21]|uniref:dolichyl-phosphate beta-glucosyltransferase n=1 Tax=Candidatus Woesebacteria bacterium RIFCSPHIGHO2_01_FULL_44_21 TaxID=1802503 RepID=A0A1F7YXQ1_9BACT|nr:MAG: hypothetical protein A2803_02650 [Candidatus Woesebacteria bacterium RIFCSPHIGHO2_01_FULL_44_21]OGM69828.1 MAG: hypothetical protein A2897_00595 [Candidatus Woesebacteria bacterium RIFCSPLOWO2_01_FULL_44_24b]